MARIYLLVDADENDATRFAQQLRAIEPGCEVLLAGSGPAGLALLEERRVAPSLVFADLATPGMNIIQFLGAVHGRTWLEGVRVAVLTRTVADNDVMTCYRLGACAFMTKPVRRHELRAVIGDWARPARMLEVDARRVRTAGVNGFHVA